MSTVLGKVVALESEARRLLATHEAAQARTITLEDSYSKLNHLSLAQDELFRESLRAIEHHLYRAAHVLAWAGFMDFLHRLLTKDIASLEKARPSWHVKAADELREHADFASIEAGRSVGLYGKTIMKALHGLLNKRNECAHPSDFFPDLNETLGFLSELVQRISYLQSKNS